MIVAGHSATIVENVFVDDFAHGGVCRIAGSARGESGKHRACEASDTETMGPAITPTVAPGSAPDGVMATPVIP